MAVAFCLSINVALNRIFSMSQRRECRDFFLGIALLILCHLAFVFFFLPLCDVILTRYRGSQNEGLITVLALLGIGIAQALYVIPLCLYLAKRRRYMLMKGVIIGACITALLNGACYIFWDTY
jgi:uncharacterized BrkB/YihY/UPF0761 family membrane protein